MLIRKEHLNLIRKIAWSFYSSTGIEWQELFSEASLQYCEALKSYDPEKGRITTHLWNCIKSGLINFVKKENKYRSYFLPLNGSELLDSPGYLFDYYPMITYSEKTMHTIEKALREEKKTRMILKTKYHRDEFIVDQIINDMKTIITFPYEIQN
jgi:DNA-directed RNA polymerase specialized sigma subunit